jgi:electron transfer flavoprotein beta subunit
MKVSMKIAVLVKQVPDTGDERSIDTTTGRIVRDPSGAVIDEISERALEVALAHKDSDPATEIVVLSMGPEPVTQALRKALSMGADSAVHVIDDSLVGADIATTARALAAALRRIGADLVVTGNESTDGRGGVLPAMLAEHLGHPHLTFLTTLEIDGQRVRGERGSDGGVLRLAASLPAVVSVTERFPEVRFPSFKGIMSAKKKPLEVLDARALGLTPSLDASEVTSVTERPARSGGTKIVDHGNAAKELADFLSANRLI